MVLLNDELLKDIFKKLAKEADFNDILKFSLSGSATLEIFVDFIKTVKSISLFSDSLKISFVIVFPLFF